MISLQRRASLALAAIVAFNASTARAATFAELAAYLPDDANAVVVVNAAALYGSPLGQSQGWKQRYADAFEAAPMVLPPSALRGVLGAELDLRTMRPDWQAAAMELSIDPTTEQIAERLTGLADVISGVEAVWLPGNTCVLKFAPNVFGLLTPANRQEAARWIADSQRGSTGQLSAYLEQSIGYADHEGTQLVLAIDLEHVLSEATLAKNLTASDVLNGIDATAAARILASLQGVAFGVKVTDRIYGALRFDFAQSPAALEPIAKQLVLKAVAKAGAMLPEFSDWTAETTATSIFLKGELSEDGMRRIFSLLALDAAKLEPTEAAAPAPGPGETATAPAGDAATQAMARASLRYFRGVSKYVEDISRLQQAGSLDQAIMWVENYARKVEQLSTRNVDPDLAEYGRYVAQSFRAIVDQASGAIDDYDAASAPVVSNYRIGFLPTARTVNYGGDFQRMYAPYGYADVDPQATQANQQKTADQLYSALQQARQTLSQLLADNETVRKNLSEKYGLKF